MTVGLAQIRNLLVDMDGVLYRGLSALPGACDLISFLEGRGIGYLLVTNNSTMTAAQFRERLLGMGMDVPEARILTSGAATAAYLASQAPPGTLVNVIGEASLIHELETRGFVIAGREAAYVVSGWDRALTFDKLRVATLAIRNGAAFIGTNPDKTYPLECDIIPGAGSIQAALVAATGVEPLIIGKPATAGLVQALEILGARPDETAMLGDRLDTDILGGYRAGMHTIMVLTGISTAEEAATCEVPPDLMYPDLPTLIEAWERALD